MKKRIVSLLLSSVLLITAAFTASAACSHSTYITYYDSVANAAYKICCLCYQKAKVSISSTLFAYADAINVHKGDNEVNILLSKAISNCQSGAISVSASSGIKFLDGEWLFNSSMINSFDPEKGKGVFSLSKASSISGAIMTIRFNIPDTLSDGDLAYIKIDSLMYNAKTKVNTYSIPLNIVSEHNFENNICTVCGCESHTEENGCNWCADKNTITFTGNDFGELSFEGTPWNSYSGSIKKVVFSGNIAKLDKNSLADIGTPEIIEVLGNPVIEDGAFPVCNKIRGFTGTFTEEYCNGKIKFESIEEFSPKGYQEAIDSSTAFRLNSQMRWAEFYKKAGFDIVAEDNDGSGNITKKRINIDIKTVYRTISGNDSDGNVITVFTPDNNCYASALKMSGLPEITDDRTIEFTFTPYVYNIYSDEKITLEPVCMLYSKDGIVQI